jgi:trk system potassium uptake protein TrkH
MGDLCGVLAVLSLAPFAVTIGYGEFTLGLRYLIVAVILSLPALLSLRLRAPRNLQTNEAMSITVLAFMIGAAAMIYPFMGSGLSFMDALFEAISGITTTGLTTLTDVEDHSRGFLFARAWLQWYGGLGVVVLSLALVMGPGAVARRLAVAGGDVEDIVGTSRGYARRVMVVYLLLTLAGIAAAMALLQDPFYTVVHVLTAVSTGGFSSFNNSLAHLEGWGSRMVLFTLCIAGAIPLALYYRAWRGGWRQLLGDRELQTLLVLILLLTLILWMILRGDGQFSGLEAMAQATATAITTQTGSGFSTLNVADLDPTAKATLILSMLIGGGMGSTTGGIKIIRLLILLRLMQILLLRTSLPSHAVMHPRLHGHRLETEETQYALLFILLYILVIVLSWLPFLAYGYDPLDALFEVVSATATVGLSTGVTSPTLELPLKAILCLDMLLGRVEVCALLVLIYPRTWVGRG